jgi:hypothetical protein
MKTNKKQFVWRAVVAVLVLAIGFFVIVPPVHAAEINNSGIVKAGETINDDLVLSSDSVRMDGTVNGMLMTFSNDVVINGEVNGDLVAFGRSVTITDKGSVDGNIFTAAQNISIDGKVTGSIVGASMTMANGPLSSIEGNQYYAGYSFSQSAGSITGRDIRAGIYQAILDGETGQDAVIYGEAVEVTGKINRNAEFIVGNPATETQPVPPFIQNMGVSRNLKPGLRVNPLAVIGGVMSYTSKVNQSSAIAATPAGGIVFHTPVPSEEEKKAAEAPTPAATAVSIFTGFAGFASNLISLLLIGGLLLWKFPVLFNQNVDMVTTKPWPSTLFGFITIVVGYAAMFLALVVIILAGIIIGFLTIGGLGGAAVTLGLSSLATVAALFSLAVSHISKVIVAYLVGKWVFSKLAPTQTNVVWPLVIGVLIYTLLRAIPFVGLLFGIAATLLGVGAMWLVFRQKTSEQPVQTI